MAKTHRQTVPHTRGQNNSKQTGQVLLIVEDVEISREFMADLLRFQLKEMDVVTATSVMEARRVLLWARPRLVLLDEILPGESAMDLLKDLVQAKIPTVLLTSLEEDQVALSRPIPNGALGRIRKPSFDTTGSSQKRSADSVFVASVIEKVQKG